VNADAKVASAIQRYQSHYKLVDGALRILAESREKIQGASDDVVRVVKSLGYVGHEFVLGDTVYQVVYDNGIERLVTRTSCVRLIQECTFQNCEAGKS
jgi:predicted ATP-grasp superfamily ATP-dependent carboligase